MNERPIIKTPYLFNVKTEFGDVVISMPETEWDVGVNVKVQGDQYAVEALRVNLDVAIGMYGTPLNIDFTTPMDINAGLLCLKEREKIESFEILIGYVPEESPSQVGDDGETREVELDEKQ